MLSKIINVALLLLSYTLSSVLAQDPQYNAQVRRDFATLEQRWGVEAPQILSANAMQNIITGDLNLAKRARLLIKYDPEAVRGTPAYEDSVRYMRRNIVRITNNEFVEDVKFLATRAVEAETAARRITRSLQALDTWQTAWGDMRRIFNGEAGIFGRRFQPTALEQAQLHGYIATVDQKRDAYNRIQGTGLSLHQISVIIRQIADHLVVWLDKRRLPLDFRHYLSELVKLNPDNRWWLSFNERLVNDIVEASAAIEQVRGQTVMWFRNDDDTIRRTLRLAANDETGVQLRLLEALQNTFMPLIRDGFGTDWGLLRMVGLYSRPDQAPEAANFGNLQSKRARSFAELKWSVKGSDGKHGINEALGRALRGANGSLEAVAGRRSMTRQNTRARNERQEQSPGMEVEITHNGHMATIQAQYQEQGGDTGNEPEQGAEPEEKNEEDQAEYTDAEEGNDSERGEDLENVPYQEQSDEAYDDREEKPRKKVHMP